MIHVFRLAKNKQYQLNFNYVMNCVRLFKLHNIQSLCRIRSVKFISQHPLKFLENEERWRQKDQMSKEWNLIYKAPMGAVLNFTTAYLTVTTTTVTASLIYYALFAFDVTSINDPIVIGDDVVIANNAYETLIYLGSFILFHVAVKVLLSKFVVRLYQNGDEYTAIFRGNWYDRIVKHQFHLNEFKKLNPTLVVSWGESRYGLGKKHGILLDEYFKTPQYLNYLLYKNKGQ